MAKADLHAHSKYSGRPSDWFLKRIGTNESYTEPEALYAMAKEQGMDYVTISDHNKIEGAQRLAETRNDVIIGCEFSTYFPEDGCKMHLLTYGISEKQFNDIQTLRKDIYETREYIKENNIAYSLAHAATFNVNGKLTLSHLERCLLLFDVFEGINGARNSMGNELWIRVLQNLTPDHIDDLYRRYRIEPMSFDPWVKGITGGSDDHAGLYIGRTYTEGDATTKDAFLEEIRQKKTRAGGRHNDYRSFAFILYKILYDFSRSKSTSVSKTLISQITGLVFEKKSLTFMSNLKLTKIKWGKKKDKDSVMRLIADLVETLRENKHRSLDETLDTVFDRITQISDGFLRILIKALRKDVKKGDLPNLIKNVSAFLPGAFLSVPFYSTLVHMYSGRRLFDELEQKFLSHTPKRKKKVLWFTDTLTDMNGVAITLRKMGWLSHESGRDLNIVTALLPEEINETVPPNVINIPIVYDFKMPFYEKITLKIPSVLRAIEMLYSYEPDEIYISSPGPVGMLGLFLARLTSTKSVGVYHTDFTEQARRISKNDTIAEVVETGMRWFYTTTDKVAVPTNEYMDIIEARGIDRTKMSIFKRGIDHTVFAPKNEERFALNRKLNIRNGVNLLYAGRISQDKNLDFLMDLYLKLTKKREDINLLIAGEGPYHDELRKKMKKYPRIVFLGALSRETLPDVYAGSDLFLFPSNTDTFGMVVLEAQSCGLPAIVSDIGGPREIVLPDVSGFIISTEYEAAWLSKVENVIDMIETNDPAYRAMRKAARAHIIKTYTWDAVFSTIFEEDGAFAKNESKTAVPPLDVPEEDEEQKLVAH